jgi:hypothetical protein
MTRATGIVKGPVRRALDLIRRELGMEHQKNACPTCGDEHWEYPRSGRYKNTGRPIEACETCGRQRVRAENLLRAIVAHAQEGLGKRQPSGLGHNWGGEHKEEIMDSAGRLDPMPPPREVGG